MEHDHGALGAGASSTKEDNHPDVENEKAIYNKIQAFFASINGGFCQQIDEEDVTDGDFYQVLEFITTNTIFPVRKETNLMASFLSLSVRYDNETKVIEDLSYSVSFHNKDPDLEGDFFTFTRSYRVNEKISDFILDKNTILENHHKDFKASVFKFKKGVIYN